MKLFVPTGEKIEYKYTMRRQDKPNAEESEVTYIQERLSMNDDTVAYLLDESKGGSTISRIRQFIAYLYNADYYTAPNLFSMMRNADEDHAELITNIIESCSLTYGDSCFTMIKDLAPKIIEKFEIEEVVENV